MKILKSKKALSPVVASIILIAVTVAVSLAVAIWMGSLTGGYMKTEELQITGYRWGTNYINITLTTKTDVVLTGAMVDDKPTTCYRPDGTTPITQTAPWSLAKGSTVTVKVMNVGGSNWTPGLPYKITIMTQSAQYPWTGNANP
jgi:flagellin-like protein